MSGADTGGRLAGPLLALDASTSAATAALLSLDGEDWGCWIQPDGLRGTAALAPAVADLLWARGLSAGDLGGLVVGTGPGSYTGLRSAIAFARALAWPSRRPLVGWPSVASAAAALLAARPEVSSVITVVDARRGQCYRADYVRGDGPAGCVEVLAPALVAAGPLDTLPLSEGQLLLREPRPSAPDLARLASPRLAAGGDDPATVLPLYLKRSHAEIALDERRR